MTPLPPMGSEAGPPPPMGSRVVLQSYHSNDKKLNIILCFFLYFVYKKH
jgi:hypothetical protein